MVLGKKVAIFDWEWGRNSAPRDGQKRPCTCTSVMLIHQNCLLISKINCNQKISFGFFHYRIS